MKNITKLNVIICASLMIAPSGIAYAQSNGLGGFLNDAVNQIMKKNTSKPAQKTSTSPKAENKEIQRALNHYGYSVGTVDGSLGKRSRNAISDYQKSKGMKATGKLTSRQKSELLTSYRNVKQKNNNAATQAAAIGALGLGSLIIKNRNKNPATAHQNSIITPVQSATTPASKTNNGMRRQTPVNTRSVPAPRGATIDNRIVTRQAAVPQRSITPANVTDKRTERRSLSPPANVTDKRTERRSLSTPAPQTAPRATTNSNSATSRRLKCLMGQTC